MAVLDICLTARELAGNISANYVSRYATSSDTATTEYRSVQYAVRKYSEFLPRKLVVAFLPTGAKSYDLTSYIASFNLTQYKITDVILRANTDSVTYSIGNYDQNKLDKNNWSVFKNPLDSNKPYLRFLNGTEPGSSSTDYVFLEYTAPHIVDTTTDTITSDNPEDVEAFCYLVASRLLFVAGSSFARLTDSTLDITSVDFQSKTSEYMKLSKEAKATFMEHIQNKIEFDGRVDWDSQALCGGDKFWYDRDVM